jgi:hypothetical protein
VVPLAPRYDQRIVDAVAALDDRRVPIAEVCRRVGAAAERMDLFRPSYVHIRRLVHAHRIRQDEIRELVVDVVGDLLAGKVPDFVEVTLRARDLSK